MKEIKDIVKQIREELEAADRYAKEAAKIKEVRSTDSSTYAEMARQELGHVDSLHNMAVRMIEKEKALDQQVPPAMQAVWDWEHEQMIDRVARIKSLLSMA